MSSYETLIKAVINGDGDLVESEVNKALKEGENPQDVIAEGLMGGMSIVGERFRGGDMFVPEVIMSANAMHKGIDIIKPLLAESDQKLMGKVVIGTVEGDIHDIGKKLVCILLEGNGFEVEDIGIDVKNEEFAEAVAQHKPDIVGMSALLTTTMPNMGHVIKLLEAKGIRNNVKIMVGGASVSQEFADSIGADGYAPDAGSAAVLAKKIFTK